MSQESRNPYRVQPPFYVSFSGGKTSGYLLRHVLDAYGGQLPQDSYVLFANTGKEDPATLDFVLEVERRWCPVVWLEWVDGPRGHKFKVVNHETASRDGAPFSALISKRSFLPNPVTRFCTQELKVKTMQRYLRSLGHAIADVTAVIGLRADEHRRVSRIRADPSRDIQMPLADAGVTRDHVDGWWLKQEFQLRLPNGSSAFGNCDCCFLKSRARIEEVIASDPKRADWWIEQERKIGGTFRSDRPTYQQMRVQLSVQGRLFGDPGEESLPCDCTE